MCWQRSGRAFVLYARWFTSFSEMPQRVCDGMTIGTAKMVTGDVMSVDYQTFTQAIEGTAEEDGVSEPLVREMGDYRCGVSA